MDFIRRERLYIFMLFFIAAVNALSYTGIEKKHNDEEINSLSTKTFEEIGITEEKVKIFFASDKPGAGFFKYSIVFIFSIFIVSILLNLNLMFRKARIALKKKTELGRVILCNSLFVPWGILDLIRAGIVIMFIAYLISISQTFISNLFNIKVETNLRMMIDTFFIDITAISTVLYFVIVKYREGIESLGLRFRAILKNILEGLSAYIFILPLLLIVLVLSIWVLNIIGYSPPPQPIFDILIEEKRSPVLLFLTVFISIFGPIVEEIFFRGFMYNAIKKHLGVIGAIFLTACIFSFLHTNIVGFLPIMALGVLLAYLYEKTNSLVSSMTVHIVHNSIVLGFVFFIKQLSG